MITLGISAYYHDSAAAIVKDGIIMAAAQEERFTRKKWDKSFPSHAVRFCLKQAGITLNEVDHIGFYDKPLLTFDRLLETYFSFAPQGLTSFVESIPIWVKEKLLTKSAIEKALNDMGLGAVNEDNILFGFHHHSHAASAFYPSPFDHAAVLVLDGVGEWATSTLGWCKNNEIELLRELRFPHSLGMLYSAFTYYLGFRVNDGEYKIMGLAPYGEPKQVNRILDELIDLQADGSFRLNMDYFNYCTGLTMTNRRFDQFFGGPPRNSAAPLTREHMDLASSIQAVAEEVILRLCRTAHAETGEENLCMAGGVALNCVANGRIMREGPFKNLWIQPAAGDSGASLGVALAIDQIKRGIRVKPTGQADGMNGCYLGPEYGPNAIHDVLKKYQAIYHDLDDETLFARIAQHLEQEKIVGWFQGRMEFGPRALGNRSILGDARSNKMQRMLNLKIKYRESFRPFAPAVLAEQASDYFQLDRPSPYMLLVGQVQPARYHTLNDADKSRVGLDKLKVARCDIPAVTHVDYSARIQTVHKETNPRFHRLLTTFQQITGYGVLVNTSFNIRDEPVVCSPEDAYRCFMGSEMDILVLGNTVLYKGEQA